jgi:hypothetical protein
MDTKEQLLSYMSGSPYSAESNGLIDRGRIVENPIQQAEIFLVTCFRYRRSALPLRRLQKKPHHLLKSFEHPLGGLTP